MRVSAHILIFYVLMLISPFSLFSEGTPELLKGNCSNDGYIQIWDNGDSLRQFATWNCDPEYRLNIRIAKLGEYIHMGFKQTNEDVWYRLKDPTGNVVFGPNKIASGEPGWVDNCSDIMNGPKSIVGGQGYDDVTHQTMQTGDYYIEFAIGQDPTIRQKRIFDHFDITVSEEETYVRTGRLWSQAWDLTTDGGSNTFEGSFYAYSNDSVVTKFDFNGIQPWGFTISCNSYGASDVGSLKERRKSDYRQNILNNGGEPGAPEYPLFLNNPDENEFPHGQFGFIDSFDTNLNNNNCIEVWVNKDGQVETVLEFENGSQVNLIDSVSPGYNCINWNGNDGNGDPVQADDTVWITLKYTNGITHLPLIDVEDHINGYTVELVRPLTKPNGDTVPDPLIFWNDSLLTDPQNSLDGVAELDGAGPQSHQWHNRGNSPNNVNPEVINTWWYSSLEEQSYTVIYPQILKIKLSSFKSKSVSNGIRLHWSSSVEEQADFYEVERSYDGRTFETIGKVQAHNRPSSYEHLDKQNHPADVVYYRLKLFDMDGSFEYSEVVPVAINQVPEFKLGWNATTHDFKIHSPQNFVFRYVIHDVAGRKVREGQGESNNIYSLQHLNPGMYTIQVVIKGRPSKRPAKMNQKLILH